jgi:hypothetical protein
MNKKLIIICLISAISFTQCKKNDFNYLSSNHPAVPVTITNIYLVTNGLPTVLTSISGGGAITISMSIPASSGRTIKEITRVGTATTPTNYKVVEVSTGLYNTAPIAVNGTTYSFTTSLTEVAAKTGTTIATGGTATSFLGRYFYFLITLDDGTQLIPVPVRIYVNA